MPQKHLVLRQSGSVCEVVFYDSDKQTRGVLFSGGRWNARKFLKELRTQANWQDVPAFCEKESGALIENPIGKL